MNNIIILGRGEGWQQAPEGECWAVCSAMMYRISGAQKSLARGFDIHDNDIHTQIKDKAEVWEKIAKDNNVKYYTCKGDNGTIKFPLEELVEYFKTDYFSNTICYMIALALYEGVERIDLYGVNMIGSTELYTTQRACIEFWLGMAIGIGVEVNVHGAKSSLFMVGDGKMYGYSIEQKNAGRYNG